MAIGSAVVSWLIVDARTKAKLSFLEDKVEGLAGRMDEQGKSLYSRSSTHDLGIGRLEQSCEEMRRGMERLEETKASRELVDNITDQLATLRADIDKRFDRLERLIEQRGH